MSRSNAPLALSVVKVTVPGDVAATVARLKQFDGGTFGFDHEYTWKVMPQALRGVLEPSRVSAWLTGKHPRVAKCVEALVRLGRENPLETRAFADFPESGIRPISAVEWGPDVIVRAKATCWYVDADGNPVLPLLLRWCRKSGQDAKLIPT